MTDREDAARAQPDRVGNLSAGEVGRAGSTGFGVRLGRGAHQRGVRARTFARSGRNLKSVRSFRQGSRSIEYIGSAHVPGSHTPARPPRDQLLGGCQIVCVRGVI